jgi:hypothetical protein
VHKYVGRFDRGFRQCRLETGYTLRLDSRLVAIEARDGREDLQRRHAGVAGAKHRHVDPAIVDRMRAKKSRHCPAVCRY